MATTSSATCDRSQAEAATGGAARHPRWVLATCILASSLAFLDGSVVNVALSALGRDLHATTAELQWTINAYMLPLSALLILGGALGDRFGRRRLLVGGIGLFLAASVACALAPGLAVLLPARAAQGVGAAMLMPNSLAILGNAFSGKSAVERIGLWAAVGAIASAVGPPLGGWLVEAVGWEAIFYINVPVAAAGIVVALRFVDESETGDAALDWTGALLATGALFALTWGLTLWSAHRGVVDAPTWIGIAAGVAMLVGFVLVERHRGERAMMPLALFGSKAFAGLSVLTFLLYGALGGLLVLLPYVLIAGGGYTPLTAGFALLPFPLVVGVASRAMGRLTERVGPRWPLTVGPAVTAVGFALLVRVETEASYWTSVLPGILVISLGMAGAVAPLTTAVLSSVGERHTGTASGFNSAISRTGGLIATALAGGVLASAGAALVDAFHIAALIGVGAAGVAAATAFITLDSKA